MKPVPTVAASDTFAANRASGHIVLSAAAADGGTRRRHVHEAGSLRVRFPHASGDTLEAVIVNTGGGMAGGDRFSVDMTLSERASLLVGTAAAEKIYRTAGAEATLAVTLAVGRAARLCWLPQETILFDGARLRRRIGIKLAEDASLMMAEAVVFGRTAMGEVMRAGLWNDHWRLYRGGRLVFAENALLDGAVSERLMQRAVAGGGVALATVLIAPANEDTLAAVRALAPQFAGEVGISAWNGIAVARLVAGDGVRLRHDLIALVAALGVTAPRLWLQ